MTADTLLLEYSDWVAVNNDQHGAASFARFVIDVVLPREFLKAYNADRYCGCVQQ